MKVKNCPLLSWVAMTFSLGSLVQPGIAQSNNSVYQQQQAQQRAQQAAQQARDAQRQAQQDQMRQQQRQQMQDQMRQQQQQQMRQQMQDQMRQQQQQQMRQQQQDQMRQQQQQQMQQQQRQQQQQAGRTTQLQNQQRQQLSAAQNAQQNGRPAPRGTSTAIVNRTNDRVVFSNGVAKLTRPLTSAEISRGFTGKVTSDGRALVKFQNNVFAVPAARVGFKVNTSANSGSIQASRWSASKRTAINDNIKQLALKGGAGVRGSGGPLGSGGAGGDGGGDKFEAANDNSNRRPKSSPNFQTPTNPPQAPPKTYPAGYRLRVMPPTEKYPNGYWRLEKPMDNGGWQGINPSTMKPGAEWDTHVPLPPKG